MTAHGNLNKLLASLKNYEGIRAADYATERPSLEPFKEFLKALGSPQKSLETVIIAGSKGKGSVLYDLEAMLRASGLKTGAYTSPHLLSVTERIRLDGRDISPEILMELVGRTIEVAEEIGYPLSFFECMTACALLFFAQNRADLCLLEVGLGGRLDATNVTSPVLAVITTILLEHTKILGDDLTSIATEKAAVIRDGCPVVSAPQAPEAVAVINARAAAEGTRVHYSAVIGDDVAAAVPFETLNRAVAHQAFRQLMSAEPPPAWQSLVRKSGRFDRRQVNGRTVIIDCAHHPTSLEAFLERVSREYGEYELAFACLSDKDVAGMLNVIRHYRPNMFYVVQLDDRRAVKGSELINKYLLDNDGNCAIIGTDELKSVIMRNIETLVVSGSFRIAGLALEQIEEQG